MPAVMEVLRPGMLTTVQDRGRNGFQKFGVSVSGAMDFFSHRVANRLVENDEQAATLECTLLGPSLRFLSDTTLAVTGAELSPQLDGVAIPMWESIAVKRGTVLGFGKCRRGCRAYVGIAGGIDVPLVLGSRSTHTRTRLGGVEGRALRKGDIISSFEKGGRQPLRRFLSPFPETVLASRTLRFVFGPGADCFQPASLEDFQNELFRVSSDSDRMGIRFVGKALTHRGSAEIISSAVPFGLIQVPANGQPIVLAADRQTTGGYSSVGVVSTADFPVLAQLKPGDGVHFQSVALVESLHLLNSIEAAISEGCGVEREAHTRDSN
jgi:antagonist of KipI